eukprot:Skav224824  [mRNA]  locus=scaffold613:242369:245454:+ [translate_table: standard]
MRLLPERQDALLLWIAQARHAHGHQAQQHAPHPIPRLPWTELAIGHVLRISGEVGARAPHRTVPAAGHQGLKARWIP